MVHHPYTRPSAAGSADPSDRRSARGSAHPSASLPPLTAKLATDGEVTHRAVRPAMTRVVSVGLSVGLSVAVVIGLTACGTAAGSSPAPLLTTAAQATAAPPPPVTAATSSTPPALSTSEATAGAPSASPPAPRVTESNPPGDIPDNQAFVPYTPAGAPFTVKVPEGWARTTGTSGTTGTKAVSFTDKLNRIDISSVAATGAPSPASVRGADLPRLQASVPRFTPGQVTTTTRSGSPAILVTYQGDSAPNPVTGKVVRDAFERYIFYRAGTRVDLTLIGPITADNVDPWRIVSDSLTWK